MSCLNGKRKIEHIFILFLIWPVALAGALSCAARLPLGACNVIELAARHGGRAARGGVAVTAVGGDIVWHY